MSGEQTLTAAHLEWQPRVNPWIIALSVMLATFMEVLDTSIASVALPHIAGNLSATQDEATWVLTSYLVSNAIVLPASAWFSSFFGRKRFLMTCIAIFTVSSFMCGAATSLGMLIVARVVQGAGGGALQPLAQSIVMESFPPARRGVAMAVYGVGVICAPIIGPTFGGWLTDTYSWRWAFYINIPVGILAVMMISMFVEDPPYIRASRRGRLDVVGFGLMSLWLATMQISLDKGQQADWFGAVWMRWSVGISAAAFVGFIIWELRAPAPVVDLHIFKNWNFAVGCILFAMFGAAIYGLIALQPLFLQTLLGYTALDAGMTVSPRGLGALAAMFMVGALTQRTRPRILLGWGFLMFALSAYLLSRLTLEVSMRNIVLPNVLNGFGSGFIFVPLSTVTLGLLRNDQIGNAAGIQNLVRNVGGSIGISFISTMLDRYAQAHQVFLAGHLSPLNPAYRDHVNALTKVFASHYSPADALQRAEAMVYNTLLQQASYWAFVQLFYVIMWVCIACLFGVLLLRNVKGARVVAAH